uniref:non-specific serine/threonine protein kinase n=1 Tax=Setaria italica TaxID=4555 RepID=K3ZHC4_SETIT
MSRDAAAAHRLLEIEPPPVWTLRREESFLATVRACCCFDRLIGFISIDCGYTTTPKYTDDRTGITYVSDDGFTDSGLIHSVNREENMQPDVALRYSTVRSFPNGTRNCYTLQSLTPGGKYYVRAAFGYGNYDALGMPPTFDLYLGVNYWTTVSIINSSTAYIFEIVAVSPANYLQVCFVNKGLGTPFISGLDLRSLQENLYPYSTATQSLVLLSFFRDTVGFGPNRYHFGTDYRHIRYPNDTYDRIWQKYEDVPTWTILSDTINGIVNNSPNDTYGAPSAVMRSVSTPVNASTMDLWWSSDSSMNVDANTKFLVVLYFAELETLREDAFREFSVILDNNITLVSAFRPEQMLTTVFTGIVQGTGSHAISLVATPNSKPPLISAMEIYLMRPLNGSATYAGDAIAMMTIQTNYSIKRNWEGDPCSPVAFAWDGLNCTYNTSGSSRIIALYLSSNGLNGEIVPSFGQLASLQHLDLSHNNLSGSIPNFLGQLTSLTFLDLSSNNLSGPIPTSLLQKSQDGSLTLSFRYEQLVLMTENFRNKISEGGFGSVYAGKLEDQTPVAVKIRSQDSSQGDKEFLAEIKHLAIGRHRNVVTLFGYCKDEKHLGLVYEYMAGGNLEQRLIAGSRGQEAPLTWSQRLKIAVDSASGLHYLHSAFNTPLIHRDVKATNILLTEKLDAKISDFGMARALTSETRTHTVTTTLTGTEGYLRAGELRGKTDVYSFGIVLLVLITNRPACSVVDNKHTNIADWVRASLGHGRSRGQDVARVIDQRIRDHCDLNSVWKVVELALRCAQREEAHARPTMTEVVATLEALQREVVASAAGTSSSSAMAEDLQPADAVDQVQLTGAQ